MRTLMHVMEQWFSTGLAIFMLVAAMASFYFVLAMCRPTHVQLSRGGIRFIFKMMPMFMQDALCPWSKIEQVSP